jgi:Protein of unknown function (DUF4238)
MGPKMRIDLRPPLPDPDMVNARMRRLAAQATVAVHRQHLVSGVLLREFSAPIGQLGAPQVATFNLEYPRGKSKGRGLETAGEAPISDFVKFASGSLERIWWKVENEAATTCSAARHSSGLEPEHLNRLRDLVAIHEARSIQYYVVFEDNGQNVRQQRQQYWDRYPAVLDAIATQHLGLHGGTEESRRLAFEDLHQPFDDQVEVGALFRVMMQVNFQRTRLWFRRLGLEILRPSSGEFIVGDIPALAVRRGMHAAGVNAGMAYAFAESIVLPIAPDCLVRVVDGPSRYLEVDEEEVRELNAWQVRGAFSHVYSRPESGMDDFFRSIERPFPSEGIYRDFFAVCQAVRQQKKRSTP